MLVYELIDLLNNCPKELIVLGSGYESGYEKIDSVDVKEVYHHPDNPWYEGKYQTSDYESLGKNKFRAVILD